MVGEWGRDPFGRHEITSIVAVVSIDFDDHPDAATCRADAQVLTVVELVGTDGCS